MIQLDAAGTRAIILADEGAVAATLRVDGREVLARTPAADDPEQVRPLAATEDAWVRSWRGGWQLCFPDAGQPEPGGGFHGAASQAPWRVLEQGERHVALTWDDDDGLGATRTWTVGTGRLEVATTARNEGARPRRLAIAEHLILGGDVLAQPLRLTGPQGTTRSALDYDGAPSGDPAPWGGSTIERGNPASVAAVSPAEPWIAIDGSHLHARVDWSGQALPHALVWEELGASTEPPWDGAVFALGIEPTSTPHGLGTGFDDRVFVLAPGARTTWTCSLQLAWASPEEEHR